MLKNNKVESLAGHYVPSSVHFSLPLETSAREEDDGLVVGPSVWEHQRRAGCGLAGRPSHQLKLHITAIALSTLQNVLVRHPPPHMDTTYKVIDDSFSWYSPGSFILKG